MLEQTNFDYKFFVDLSAKLIEDNFKSIVEKVFGVSKKGYESFMHITGLAFKEYLKSTVKKYCEIKTILYRDNPVFLYDFFVPIELVYKRRKIDTSDVKNIFSIKNYVIITGLAGSGKSILLKHLFLNTIKNKNHIPIYVELKDFNNFDGEFLDFILVILNKFNMELTKENLMKLLESGKFVLFLDGFDEIKIEKIDITQKVILELKDKYSENIFIITSRPDNNFVSWSNFVELTVSPFSIDQTLLLIDKLNYDEEIKMHFRKEVSEKLYKSHESFLSNPLLITIMLLTFSQNAEIPNKMYLFYYQAFETLFNKHDATKAGYKRDTFTKLSIDDFMKVLSSFSINSYVNSQLIFNSEEVRKYMSNAQKLSGIEFDIDNFLGDLLKSVCILIQDGLSYTYTHRTFQEYFSAIFIANSAEDRQMKLIKKIQDRVMRDNIFKLLFEINREMLESIYVLPIIKEIQDTFFKSEEPDSYPYNFILETFSAILISKEGDVSFYVKNMKYLDFLSFALEQYDSIYALSDEYFIGTEKMKMQKQKVKEELNKRLLSKAKWFSDKSNRNNEEKKVTTYKLEINDFKDDPEFKEFIINCSDFITMRLRFLFALEELIKKDLNERAESIETILLE